MAARQPVGASLADAVRRCPNGGRILLRPGTFAEPLRLDADGGKAIHVFGGRSAWVPAITSRGGGACTVDGVLTDGVRLVDSALTLCECVVSAGLPRGGVRTPGVVLGVSLEGGAPRLLRCIVHGCGPAGVSIADGDKPGCAAVLDDCHVYDNVINVDVTAGPTRVAACRIHDGDAGVAVHQRRADAAADIVAHVVECDISLHMR